MHPLAEVAGGLLSSFLTGGGKEEGAEPTPPPPPPRVPSSLPPQRDAYVPYEPPEMEPEGSYAADPEDITEESANEWAKQNPAAAKRVAKGLLSPAMQKLIPD